MAGHFFSTTYYNTSGPTQADRYNDSELYHTQYSWPLTTGTTFPARSKGFLVRRRSGSEPFNKAWSRGHVQVRYARNGLAPTKAKLRAPNIAKSRNENVCYLLCQPHPPLTALRHHQTSPCSPEPSERRGSPPGRSLSVPGRLHLSQWPLAPSRPTLRRRP